MYILGEVNPDTPEATLAGIVGISWIDDGQAGGQNFRERAKQARRWMPPFNISVHTALTLQRMNLPWLVGHDSVPSMVGRSESEAEGNAGDV